MQHIIIWEFFQLISSTLLLKAGQRKHLTLERWAVCLCYVGDVLKPLTDKTAWTGSVVFFFLLILKLYLYEYKVLYVTNKVGAPVDWWFSGNCFHRAAVNNTKWKLGNYMKGRYKTNQKLSSYHSVSFWFACAGALYAVQIPLWMGWKS